MTKKEREKLAYLIKDLHPEVIHDICREFPGLYDEVESWKAHDDGIAQESEKRLKEWIRIAKKHGAVTIWGDTLSFQVDGIIRPDLEAAARKEFKKIHGSIWNGGNIIN